MKHSGSLIGMKLVFAACVLWGTNVGHGQDDAPPGADRNAVPLKDRPFAEKARNVLSRKWTEHVKSLGTRPSPRLETPQPQLLRAPEDERRFEETVPAPQRQSLARQSKNEYVEPEILRSKDGELKVTLLAGHAHNHIGPDPVYLRSFNGKLVGPTLLVKPGDKIRITLKNVMPGERWLPNMMNTLNSFNTLNLHYHGLHVSPNGISDNVLIQVGPHQTQEYELNIPKDHTTGTYWYHPHRHGSTAGDVASSMSGALIIEAHAGEKGLDNIPEIKSAKQRVMVLNQIPYIYKNTFPDPNSTTQPPGTITFDLKHGLIEAQYAEYIFGPGDWPKLGRYTTVNGVQLPVIRMRPGQIERWRLVDSGQREMIMLKIIPNPAKASPQSTPINFHEIAVDGLALGKIVETPTIELWPGYRSDVLVQAPMAPGEYLLIDDIAPASNTIGGSPKPLNYIARIVVDGDKLAMKMPTDAQMAGLRLPSINDSEITGQQEAKYGILLVGQGNEQTVVFTIDGASFTMETARTLKLNDVDEWTIHSINDVGPVTHPFHIHVNPFEVTSIMAPSAEDPTKLVEILKNGAVWRDTVKIPGNGYVKMRTKYTDFIGTFVQHCHILDHEDQGMMELIDIIDPNAAQVAGANSVPKVQTIAPDFSLPDSSGVEHRLSEFQDKPSVVFFFKGHGCLHCAQQVTAFAENHEAFKKQGLNVIGVTSDSVEVLKLALESRPCPFTLLADPQGLGFAKYGCVNTNGLQHGTFVIDGKRTVRWNTVGSSPFMAVTDLLDKAQPIGSVQDNSKQSATVDPQAAALLAKKPVVKK